MNESIAQIVDEVRDLPISMGEALPAVIEACDNADTSVNGLAALISTDQSLVAMLLKLANSAYYGYARRIETLPEAVVLLGFSTIKSLAIAATTMNLLFAHDDHLSPQRERIWQHSMATGLAARALARKRGNLHPEKAFVAGLLHDLGTIVLSVYRSEEFEAVLDYATSHGVSYEAAEIAVTGIDHAELGALIAEAWAYPATHCEAIRFHHNPSAAHVQPALSYCAHLADFLVTEIGIGTLVPQRDGAPDAEALAAFRYRSEDLPALAESLGRLLNEQGDVLTDGLPLRQAS